MASSNNLDALSADGELPFGHPGHRVRRHARKALSQSPPVDQETGAGLHAGRRPQAWSTTAPGTAPCAANDSVTAVYTDDPAAGVRLPRMPGAGGRGPCSDDNEYLRPLPALPGGDHRPGRGGVAPCVVRSALPALQGEGVVKMGIRPEREPDQEQIALDHAKCWQASLVRGTKGPDASGTFFRPQVLYPDRPGGPIAS